MNPAPMQHNPIEPYQESAEGVLAVLGTDAQRGLGVAEARARLERDGRNELTAEKQAAAAERRRVIKTHSTPVPWG